MNMTTAPSQNPTAAQLSKIHTLLDELTSSPWIHDVIELAMAAAISTPIADLDDTALLWLLIEGNPSGGKTRAVSSIRGPKVIRVDNLTENALASGYVPEKGQKRKPDLLTQMKESGAACLIIKDLSPLFSRKHERVEAILGDLKSIYDGEYQKATGTVGLLSYTPRFSLVACITPLALDKHHRYMSKIGSRFLTYRVPSLTDEEQAAGMNRVWQADERKEKLAQLQELSNTHVNALLTTPVEPISVTPEQQAAINRLGQLLARGRAVTEWTRGPFYEQREIETVQIEEPFRAIEQLRNLARALARIHGRSHVAEHDLELVRRVVLSSMPAGRARVLALFAASPEGLTANRCGEAIGKSDDRARQLLDELERVEIIAKKKGAPAGGSPPLVYQPVQEFADLVTKPVCVLDHLAERGGDFADKNSPPLTPA